MSVDNVAADAATPPADAGASVKGSINPVVVDSTAGADDLAKAIASRQKAKDELRNERKSRQELEAQLESIKNAEAAQQGKFKELYENVEKKYKTLHESWVKDKVRLSLGEAAKKYECQDLDLAMAAGESNLLVFDETTGAVDGADAFFEDLKARKPILFGKSQMPTVNPTVPGGNIVRTEPEDFSKLDNEGVKARLLEIAKRQGG